MNVDALVNTMTPEVYQSLLQSVETGKWLDGNPLTEEQKETCIQAVMLYQAKVLKSDQHMTVGEAGEIVHKSKRELKRMFTNDSQDENTIARFSQDDF